ncbi:MAG TPA: RHS repeat-associated core domain-containing protein, partial [Chryseolinea sp.]|nr:RHS repeat-associated core domain-containing protein [Chryseolinea sp.]
FGVSSGSTGEALKVYNGLNSYAATVPAGDHYADSETVPKAFVTIIFFDKDYNLIDAAWDQVGTPGAQTSATVKQPPHDVMTVTAKAPEAGYAYVFVSNEHPFYVDLYFDDVTVSHTPSSIVGVSDYFPFGLSYNAGERAGAFEQKYMYNGKELQDEMALNWYDYGARMYMPEIGRWGVVDPLSDKFHHWTPYNYVYNNPFKLIDLFGMEAEDPNKNAKAQQTAKKDCNCGGRELVRDTYRKDGKTHVDIYYASGPDTNTGSGTTIAGGLGLTGLGGPIGNEKDEIPGYELIRKYEGNEIRGWGSIFTAQVLAENGVGGEAIQRLRRELLENPMFSKDRHAKQVSAIMTYVSREVKLIKAMAPGGKGKDIYFSAAALYMGVLGETYLYENETEIAPLIKIANPEWYDINIAPIPRHYGHSGAGSSGSWKPSN